MNDPRYSYEYNLIQNYYGDKKSERTGIPLINHIDEGLIILYELRCGENAGKAFMLHPLFQHDSDYTRNSYLIMGEKISPQILHIILEYRYTANSYLSTRKITDLSDIRLSHIRDVNLMLIADKVQNYKDFLKNYKGKFERSEELEQYFKNWLEKLGIEKETLDRYFKLIEQQRHVS